MLLPVSRTVLTYIPTQKKTSYKSYHGHRKKNVITFSGISLECICVRAYTSVILKQCTGSNCVYCKTGHITVVEAKVRGEMF